MFKNLIDFVNPIVAFLKWAFEFWNSVISVMFTLLGMNPAEFEGGKAYQIIEKVNPYFVAVGTSLMVLAFLWGFFNETINVKEDITIVQISKMLIGIIVCEFFITNNLKILGYLLQSVTAFVKLIDKPELTKAELSPELLDSIGELDFGTSVLFFIFALVIGMIIIICSFMMIYVVYFRYIKILAVMPFSALAISAYAGGTPELRHISSAYTKYFISILLEAVMITIAVVLCNAVISSGFPTLNSVFSSFTATDKTWLKALGSLFMMVFTVSLTVGAVKGAQSLTSRILGLC